MVVSWGLALFAEKMKDKDLWHNVGMRLPGNLNSVPV